jgi:hypothetical protein
LVKARSLALLLIPCAAIGGGALWLRASIQAFNDQINNLETFKSYGHCLQESRARDGVYPNALDDIRGCFQYINVSVGTDWWGNPVQYQSDGTKFVLISFGRDGKPDGLDPWNLRERNDTPAPMTCGNPDADQVMSDLGFHRACFK